MDLATKHYFPGSGGAEVFPTDSVRFEAGAFKSCALKHVSLPNDVYGPPLCTVFDQGVTLSSDTAVNTTAELCPIEEEAEKMPLLVPLPQRTAPAAGVTQYVGLSVGKTAADAVAALEFPHSAELEKPPDSAGDPAEDTSWIDENKKRGELCSRRCNGNAVWKVCSVRAHHCTRNGARRHGARPVPASPRRAHCVAAVRLCRCGRLHRNV